MSAYMEKILKASGKQAPQVKRVLELNIDHPVIDKIKTVFEKDKNDPALEDYSNLLLDMAVISEGGKVENPARFSKMVADLMARAING
jgi:molecular chaperone HtpG